MSPELPRGDLTPSFYPSREIVDKIHQAIRIVGRYSMENKRKSNTDFFSESDIECMNNSIKKHGNLSFNQLTGLSHDKAWNAADQNDLMEIDHIMATFNDSKELSDHLQDPHPGEA